MNIATNSFLQTINPTWMVDHMLDRGDLEVYLEKTLLKKILKSQRYNFFEIILFSMLALFPKKCFFKKSYLRDFKSFLTRLEPGQIFVYYESRLVTNIILKEEKNSKLVFKISMALYSCNTTGRFFILLLYFKGSPKIEFKPVSFAQ